MPNFFIDRPIFAWVIAILITLGGVISIFNLGIESYPAIAPPQVAVSATLPGCRREHGREDGHPGDRAAAHRRRSPDVLQFDVEFERQRDRSR